MMWVQGGILYTDKDRRQTRHAGLRPMHKGAEWKVDWWLGKMVETAAGDVMMVRASETAPAGPVLVLERGEAEERWVRVPLVTANAKLRKGAWSLL